MKLAMRNEENFTENLPMNATNRKKDYATTEKRKEWKREYERWRYRRLPGEGEKIRTRSRERYERTRATRLAQICAQRINDPDYKAKRRDYMREYYRRKKRESKTSSN